MPELIEMGTVSSRGQICIPNDIRENMGLKEGNKVLFVLTDGSLIMKKVNNELNLRISKGYKNIDLSLVEPTTDNVLSELGVQ